MRVCMLTVGRSAFNPLLYAKEAASLRRAGHDVVIIAPCLAGEDPTDPRVNPLGIRVIPLMRMGWGTRWQKLIALPRLLGRALREPCDVYQVMEPQSLLAGALAKLVTRRRLVYDSREHYPLAQAVNTGRGPFATRVLYHLFWLFEAALVILAVDHVFAVDQGCVERFRRYRRPVSLLTNYPTRDFAPQDAAVENVAPSPSDTFHFLFTGVTRSRIAVLETIQAVAILRDTGISVRATFLGVVDDEAFVTRCQRTIDELGVGDAVQLIGRVPHAEVARHLRDADCGSLLYLSTPYTEYTTHPVKLFEYMAYGLPVICSDLSQMSRFVRAGEYGIAANPADPHAIANAIAFLIQHPDDARRFGANGRRAFIAQYNWETLEPAYVGVFERLNSRGRQRRETRQTAELAGAAGIGGNHKSVRGVSSEIALRANNGDPMSGDLNG